MTDLRPKPEEFVFAVLESRRSWKEALLPSAAAEAWRYGLETRIPFDADQLQAVFLRTGPGTVLACGMTHERIEQLCAVNPELVSLAPDSLPEWLMGEAQAVEPARLNLLTGPHTPISVRRRQAITVMRVALCLGLALLLLAVGLERRATHQQREAAIALGNARERAAAILLIDPDNPRLGALVTSELRTLRATRRGPPIELDSPDTAAHAAILLAHWPGGSQTERLTIGAGGVTLSAWCPSSIETDGLIAGLERAPEWTITSQTVREASGGYQVQLSLVPTDEEVGS